MIRVYFLHLWRTWVQVNLIPMIHVEFLFLNTLSVYSPMWPFKRGSTSSWSTYWVTKQRLESIMLPFRFCRCTTLLVVSLEKNLLEFHILLLNEPRRFSTDPFTSNSPFVCNQFLKNWNFWSLFIFFILWVSLECF